MVSVTAPYIGLQNNQTASTAADDVALALKMYSGEVMRTFSQKNKFLQVTRSKNVGAGKSHQFVVTGEAEAAYHVKGENILDDANGYLNNFEQSERIISIDRPLISSFVTEDWDQKIAHFETRGEYSGKTGESLANKLDRHIAQVIALAGASAATLSATQSATKAGESITVANAGTSATVMKDQMIQMAIAFTEKDVPMDQIYFCVRPSMYYALVDDGFLLNTDTGNAGNGSQAAGSISKGYGFNIMWSNHLPSTNIAAETGQYNNYAVDGTALHAIAFTPDCVGTVYREGITTESQRKLEFQGDLVVSRMMVGTGILRPECAGVIRST